MPEDIKTEIQYLLKIKEENLIAKQLQKINDLFLTQYKLHIDNIDIIPLETEIYYHKDNQAFEDKMIHKNELQKNRFGQLYFHRYKKKDRNDETNTINITRGGVDICISKGNYYLSILLRMAIINKELISGINKIQQIFYSQISDKKEKREKLKGLEKNKKELIIKRNKTNDTIYHQLRIQSGVYKKGEKYTLNSIILKYLDYSKLKKKFKEGNYGK